MKYYAVIDTNVLVSAVLKQSSIPGEVLDYVMDGKIIPLVNSEILHEYREVLSRDKFGFEEQYINELITFLSTNSVFLGRTESKSKFVDEDDRVFYEILLTSRLYIDSYLVTGNIKHFPNISFVITPKDMIDIINKEFIIHEEQ